MDQKVHTVELYSLPVTDNKCLQILTSPTNKTRIIYEAVLFLITDSDSTLSNAGINVE